MNKFEIIKCIEMSEKDYNGICVVMSCVSEPSLMLFFPVSKENAKIINYVLDDKNQYDINTETLGIYKTMIDSWNAADRFLSGIIMDSVYKKDIKDEILLIKIVLSDQEGNIDSLVYANFLHAILLSAMEKVPIILSNELIVKMLPENDNNDIEDSMINFPEDKKIMDIAKKIMNGKIKDS